MIIKNKNSLTGVIILSLISILLYFIAEATLISGDSNLCIHYYLFKMQCPLCGMLRAVYSLLHFDIQAAIYFNFTVLFLPTIYFIEIIKVFHESRILNLIRKINILAFVFCLLGLYIFRITFL